MDHNGMTEEEYLDSLLKQVSDGITKEDAVEPEDVVEEAQQENEEVAFDFDNIFNDMAEAETAPAESRADIEDTVTDVIEMLSEEGTEIVEETAKVAVEEIATEVSEEFEEVATDVSEAATDVFEEIFASDNPSDTDIFADDKFLNDFLNEMGSEVSEQEYMTETDSKDELDFSEEPEAEPEPKYEDFHRSLDSIINELEKDREATESGEIDIFNQIDNTQLSEEELNQDIDDMSLMEAVGMLLDEEEKAHERQEQNLEEFFTYDDELIEEKVKDDVSDEEAKPKKSFFNKFKSFLVEQGEDTEEDIAAQEAADAAKEAKKLKEEEDKEKKAEEEAAKKEAKEAAKLAKKEAKEAKDLERQMKKEQKKAEREASGEQKYNVTVIKLTLLFTIVAACAILLWAISDFNYRRVSKKNAMIYFTADQYELAYEAIAGLKSNDSDTVLFEQIRTVMYVQKQYDSYLSYYNIGMKEEALDALLKGIDKYDKYYENADDLGILEDMENVLAKIYTALEETYYLSAEKANAIANIEDAAEYSVALRKVINAMSEE